MTANAQVHVCSYNAQEAISWSNSDQVHRLDMCHQAQQKSSDITLPQALKSIFNANLIEKLYMCVCVCVLSVCVCVFLLGLISVLKQPGEACVNIPSGGLTVFGAWFFINGLFSLNKERVKGPCELWLNFPH